MKTQTITIEVGEEAARIYLNATREEQLKFDMLLGLRLLEVAPKIQAPYEERLQELFASMDALGRQAQANGLTEERLQEILREIEEEDEMERSAQSPTTESAG